ncbi:hypothetical protein B7494_g7399 [Chlorociboria aeruginascens]|nr:hypothetical protein B7494_g7399 [Chlorociboria aeruginascens]
MLSEVASLKFEWQTPPPHCGQRLPPVLLDEVAAQDPERVLYSIAKTHDMEDGFQDLNYRTIANAVNRCAHWLKQTLGTGKSRVFCYLGPLDLRYLILVMAAPKAGHTAFFTSYRNSLEAHMSLIERTGCSAFLLPKEPLPIARHILEGRPMETISTPDLDYFLDERPVEIVPFEKTFEEVKDEPFCILHTSGSTGIPKPVPVTYGSYGSMDAMLLVPSLGHKPTFLSYAQGKRVFLALPLFHAASLNWTVGMALFASVICILPPPAPLTAELASQIFQYSNAHGTLVAPSLVVDCYNNDTYCVKMLQSLKFIVYGGGMLPAEIGDILCKRIRLLTLMGSCETALLPHQMHDDPRDWDYISLSPCLGHTFRYERDGLSNLIIVRQKKYELHQGVFSTFPQKEEHAMGDLFEPHPTKPDLWRFRTRADDIISFTTAEKLNPTTMESTIQANSLVKSAIIGGQGQFQASLLLEPRVYPKNATEEEAFLNEVWPSILEANRGCPAHGRILKGFVMLTDPAKPLPRAGKDTVQRHAVFKLYEAEWKALYERLAQPKQASKGPIGQSSPASGKTNNNLGQGGSDTLLSDKMALAIEAIVERKVAAALEHFASALLAISNQIMSEDLSPSSAVANIRNLVNQAATIPPIQNGHAGAPNGGNNEVNGVNRVNGHTKEPADGPSPQIALHKIIYDVLGENLKMDDITDDADLFECGLDSIQVPPLLNAINAFIIKSQQQVDLVKIEVVYSNPTVARLIAAVL